MDNSSLLDVCHQSVNLETRGGYFVADAVVQLLSYIRLFVTPSAVCQAPLSFAVSQSLLKFMFIELVMLPNHLILCRPLLLLPSVFLFIRVFSNESALCIKWPKYWSFSISPSKEHSGLISFWIDWFDLVFGPGLCAVAGWIFERSCLRMDPRICTSFHWFKQSDSAMVIALIQAILQVSVCGDSHP